VRAIDFEWLAKDWIEAWNAHDLGRILEYYSANVEFISPFVAKLSGRTDDIVRGKAALRDYFGRGLVAYPALHFEFIQIYPGAGYCVLEYRSVNKLRAAEMMEFDEDGKICRVRVHYFSQEMDEVWTARQQRSPGTATVTAT